jgi:hypothetical protein
MKIREGAYYRTRGGHVFGPMVWDKDPTINYPWHIVSTEPEVCWDKRGFWLVTGTSQLDLISEVYVSDTPPSVTETEAQLREMIRDPRYWRALNPEFVKRATDGFRALVGSNTPPADAPAPEAKTLRDELVERAALEIFKKFYLTPESDVGFDWMWRAAENFVEARKK